MRRRCVGFTLIELLVVMTVLSLVWLSITCALNKLYRADQRLRDELQREQAMDRFAMRLRLDAHAASSAKLLEAAEGGEELVLSTEDERSIHYGSLEEGLYRVVRRGEAVLHRDKFLTGRATSEWVLQSPENPSLIVVTLTTRDRRTQSTRVRQIKAAVSSAKATVVGSAETSS